MSFSKVEIMEILESTHDQLELDPLSLSEHQNFDFLFSSVCSYPSLPRDCKPLLANTLVDNLSGILSQLSSFQLEMDLENSELDDFEHTKKTYCNVLKMSVYTIQQLICITEGLVKSPDATKNRMNDLELPLERLFGVFVNLLEAKIHRLWKMSLPEDSFLALFSKMCTSILENSTYFKNGKNKHLKLYIAKTLACLAEHYGQASNIANRLFYILCSFDHVWPIISTMIETFTVEYQAQILLENLLQEIGQMDISQMTGDKKHQDTSFRNISNFIVDLSQKSFPILIPHLKTLLPGIDHESYIVRNAIVQVMGHLLSQEEIHSPYFPQDKKFHGIRSEILDTLLEHLHDVHAFSRSKVLQTFGSIVTSRSLPIDYLLPLTEKVIGRLSDKTVNVRKNAIILLVAILQYNPFGASLSRNDLKITIEKTFGGMCEKQKEGKIEEEQKEKTTDEKEGKENELRDEGNMVQSDGVNIVESPEENRKKKHKEMDVKESKMRHLDIARSFIDLLDSSFPVLFDLLQSKNQSDVLESIELFVVAKSFGIHRSCDGIKKTLMLIWSKETTIKQAVSTAFQRLYLTPDASSSTNRMTKALYTANGLIGLLQGASLAEILALEEILGEVIASTDLSLLVEVFFDIFMGKVANATVKERQTSLLAISMICPSNIGFLKKKIGTLLKFGLFNYSVDSPHTPRYTIMVLHRFALFAGSPKSTTNSHLQRLPPSDRIFGSIVSFLRSSFLPDDVWYPTAESAFSFLYFLSENPDFHASYLIQWFASEVFPQLKKRCVDGQSANGSISSFKTEEVLDRSEEKEERNKDKIDENLGGTIDNTKRQSYIQLCRLLFLLGISAPSPACSP